MSPTYYVADDEEEEVSLEDDDEETISICSSVMSEETLDFVPSTRRQPARKPGLLRGGVGGGRLLTRSDGREARVFGQPSSSSQQQAAPRSPRTPTRANTCSGNMLLSSPRSRELKRRRPVNNNSSSFKPPSRTIATEPPLVSSAEDSSSSLDVVGAAALPGDDKSPACPRRAKSGDKDNWPTFIPTTSS